MEQIKNLLCDTSHKNIDEYNITNETPLVSKEYSTQVDHGTVYFITPTQQKAHGVTERVWYKKG